MKKNRLVILIIGVLLIIAVPVLYFFVLDKKDFQTSKVKYIHNEGFTQGTTYSVTYQQPEAIDLQKKIEVRLHEFDMSLSTYIPNSIISRINNNDTTVKTDVFFETMFNAAQEASERTNGALDITVGPLVKAWGFAFGNKDHSKFPVVSDFLPYVGYKKVRIKDHKLI